MENTDELLKRIEDREAEPAWQERVREKREEQEREARKVTAAAQREALAKLDLPAKDLDLLKADGGAGRFNRTLAVQALEGDVILTVLSGGTGTGKTTAAGWWLHGWILDPKNWGEVNDWGSPPKMRGSVIFVTAAKLARWARYNDSEMEAILRTSRLVIDDLGAEFLDAKGAYASLLDEVINERYANRRPTVLTTNLNAPDFKARYGERIEDRIRESGRWMALGNESMRSRRTAARQPPLSLAPPAPPRPAVQDPRLPREEDPDDVGTGA